MLIGFYEKEEVAVDQIIRIVSWKQRKQSLGLTILCWIVYLTCSSLSRVVLGHLLCTHRSHTGCCQVPTHGSPQVGQSGFSPVRRALISRARVFRPMAALVICEKYMLCILVFTILDGIYKIYLSTRLEGGVVILLSAMLFSV